MRRCVAAGACDEAMPCYHPLTAFQADSGLVRFYSRGDDREIQLPCGQCIGCRLEKSRQWATRIMFEAQLHDANSFITLTYAPEFVPDPPSLDYSHFQKFMKRLRKSYGPLRFYMCGEYGEENWRPHFHACIFGTDFPDRVFHKRLKSGFNLYRSPKLEKLWPYGFSSVADLSFESAAYVARYVTKKITGDAAADHYRRLNPDTGEIYDLVPEFGHMSLKPGIGGSWYEKYKSDASSGYVVIRGRRCRTPRYFEKLLRRTDPLAYDDIKTFREYNAYVNRDDNTDSRLAAKEIVKLAAISQLSPRGDL